MTEHSGGHYLETGDGLVVLDHPIGRGIESPAVVAWKAYIEHAGSGCNECRTSTRACPTANRLWDAYTSTRHTS